MPLSFAVAPNASLSEVEDPGAARTESPAEARFRHVLVCLDRSETAESALPLAIHLARMDGAKVALLHVLVSECERADVRVTDALGWEIARREAVAYLDGVGERLTLPTRSYVAEGASAQQVTALAEELRADLTVITTHGEGGIGPWSLGSTAQKILALARGSVLVTPARGREPAARVPPRRILVPLDGSRRTESVLPWVIRLARRSDAEVLLAHAVWEPIRTQVLAAPEDVALARSLAEHQADRATQYLENIRSTLAAEAIRSSVIVRRCSDHREGLVALAHSERADLVVICAHGSICNAQRQFGSVASYLISHSTTPLLVIQDLPDRNGRRTPSIPAPAPARTRDGASTRQ